MSSGVKGQVKFQIALIELKLREVNPGCGLSRPYTKAGTLDYMY